jgi:glycosyltransferase involved in cell wall biosynthesis
LRGHEVEVITTNINGTEKSEVPTGVPISIDGIQVRYFSSPFLRRLSWAPDLASFLKAEIDRYDVLHLHSVYLWPTWVAGRLARRAHVPYLLSPRGMLVKDLIARRSWIVKAAWINLIEQSNLEGAAAIHVTSELEKTELLRFNWRFPQVAVIPNGVEEVESSLDAIPSADVDKIIEEKQPLVLFLGRISWKKGLDRLLNAFALANRGKLAIVGPDDEGLVPELQRLAEKLRIGDRVVFLPRTVLGSDKEHLFAAAQVFVLPSYSENFGNTVLEAMQRGVPAVVTPQVGAAEIVKEAHGGMVVQGDPKPLGEAINRLINDQTLAQNMGEAGRCYVLEHYGWPHIAAQMEGLYENLKNLDRISNQNTI